MKKRFFIVGAQRSGTTYLYKLLDSHPEIYMAKPMRPEPKFFCTDKNFKKGKNYYLYKFDFSKKHQIFGEKSTSYMTHKETPKRIYNIFPNSKLIFLLRNPIKRAVSNYWFSVNNNLETKSFEYAIKNEEERIKNIKMKDFVNHPFAYKKRGAYIKYINNYLKFFSKEEILILKSENLFWNKEYYKKVYNFLKVNKSVRPNLLGEKTNNSKKRNDVLNSELINYLKEYYKEYDQELKSKFGISWDYNKIGDNYDSI
ncbi:MAG: sulfotransferase family protein [Bacillota bacterium]